ncbi:MAG: CRISPR-associated protein [Muribaculaceae bacterium]|nr:CRISPR-associated protein [Muribaculaceae bacterium]
MKIQYKVRFFTDWHCGSGMSAGADVDALVVKDRNGLPYIPGRTIKGLLREAVDDIISFRTTDMEKAKADNGGRSADDCRRLVMEAFGYFDGKAESSVGEPRPEMRRGCAFFRNAELPEDERNAIVKDGLQPYLYRTISNTAIDEYGIAVDHSLRRMEVTVPCALEGEILDLPDDEEFKNLMIDALKYIKRLGQNRNRGLGRCAFSEIPVEEKKTQKKE